MLVDATWVPGAHLDPESIEAGTKALLQDAVAVREAGIAVSTAWQGLGACYQTPETDQVLRAMDPVLSATAKVADDLDQIARALSRFADNVRSLQLKRSSLIARIGDFRDRVTAEAGTFGTVTVLGTHTGQLAFENTTLLSRSRLLGEEFEAAELECASAIKAIGSPATLLETAASWTQGVIGAGQTVWNSLVTGGATAWDWTGDAVATSWAWTTERVEDAADWVGDRGEVIAGSWRDVGEAWVLFGNALSGTDDDPRPQLTQVGAAWLQVLGATLDERATTLTAGLWDVDFAGDGNPAVSTPIRYDGTTTGQEKPRELNGLQDLLWSITDSYTTNEEIDRINGGDWAEGSVRVTKVTPPGGGEPVMVVSIPGTQPWFPWDDPGNDHPADFIGNLIRAAGGRSTYGDAVALAIDEVIAMDPDLDTGTPILLAGHSQGGMTAADLASDPGFLSTHNVTDVVTDGAPIDNDRIDRDVHVLEVQHANDLVPKLDTEDVRVTFDPVSPLLPYRFSVNGYEPDPARHTEVTLPDPGSPVDLPLNHDDFEYGKSVAAAIATNEDLQAYEDRLSQGETRYLIPGASRTVYDVPITRE